ncbi:MAG: hypothetical protein H6598_08445 [Flavobacteriales bacterium]|nr:hypothetical protein [Flavobacteriales bacterium]MCB9196239.1 hypothetical protein [Flavobacteriales bacterium]
MILPNSLLLEVEDMVELSDDSESEEDKELDDETEWKWNVENDLDILFIALETSAEDQRAIKMGETSDGERIIFSPPPENLN